MTTFPSLQTQAGQAIPESTRSFGVSSHVVWRVFVTVFTVCLSVLFHICSHGPRSPYAYAAIQVHGSINGLQMARIDAAVNSAQVVKVQRDRHGANEQPIADSMCQLRHRSNAVGCIDPCVTVLICSPEPKPTSRIWLRKNTQHKSFEQVHMLMIAELST